MGSRFFTPWMKAALSAALLLGLLTAGVTTQSGCAYFDPITTSSVNKLDLSIAAVDRAVAVADDETANLVSAGLVSADIGREVFRWTTIASGLVDEAWLCVDIGNAANANTKLKLALAALDRAKGIAPLIAAAVDAALGQK